MPVVRVEAPCTVPTFVDTETGKQFKLGRAPARVKAAPRLRQFLDFTKALPAPAEYNLSAKAAQALSHMYMNDTYGCCVISGKAHAVGVWSANDNAPIIIATDREITNEYFGTCGPGDQGCYIPAVLDKMRDKGLLFGGQLRKIAGWVAGDPADIEECKVGIILFGGFCIGFNVPSKFMNIGDGGTWDIAPGERWNSVGGHDVQIIGYNAAGVILSTWGGLRTMTWRTLTNRAVVDELYYILSPDWTNNDKLAPNGVNVEELEKRLAIIGGGTIPDWEPVVPPPSPPPVPPSPPSPPVPPLPPPPVPITITLNGTAHTAAYTFTIRTGGIFGSTQEVTIPGQAIPITVTGPLPTLQLGEPMFLLRLITKVRTDAGVSLREWSQLVEDVKVCNSDADLETLRTGKYGKITPEQWAAIIQLILTLLPLFMG